MQTYPQQETMKRRLPVVIIGMVLVSVRLVWAMAAFQGLPPDVVSYMDAQRDLNYQQTLRLAGARGLIYDRNGEPLAVNTLEYRIGISPNLVEDPRATATQLASILGLDELATYQQLTSAAPYELLKSPVSPEVTHQVEALNLAGIRIEKIPLRSYPQGTLAAQILGFVNLDLQGNYGVEGYYQDQLAGQVRNRQVSNIPFDQVQSSDIEANPGKDLILTIDRDVQFATESELLRAIDETGAQSGTIIVMNPRNGDILALANFPSFDPNAYYNVPDSKLLADPAISSQYEPGSVMKILTVSSALETGAITPDWSYNDQESLEVGGVTVENWDRGSHGVTDVTQVLVQSLNVGAATISMKMGPTDFYSMFSKFGIGRTTGVDLDGEAAGTMYVPGDENWSESQLATNAFGQGIAVTPLQLLTAVNAVANGGLMMEPHVIHEIRDGQTVYPAQPAALGRPISAQTAQEVTNMLVATVRDGVDQAGIDGYTIAGKSGTAEIPTPIGYETNAWIMTFIGYLPADDPQVSILVKLDRPTSGRWASTVAAPVFQRLAERLVLLLEIPPDDIRHQLAAQGGSVTGIHR